MIKKSTKFALFMGCVYFSLFLFICINFSLSDTYNTQYVGFIATTKYPYLALLGIVIAILLSPITLIIYIVLFFTDKKNVKNNEVISTVADDKGSLQEK